MRLIMRSAALHAVCAWPPRRLVKCFGCGPWFLPLLYEERSSVTQDVVSCFYFTARPYFSVFDAREEKECEVKSE